MTIKTHAVVRLSLFTLLALGPTTAHSLPTCPQGQLPDDSGFIQSRIKSVVDKRASASLVAQVQQRNNTNQAQLPNVATNSPSLVDESSVSDLVGVALNMIGVSSGSDSSDTTSTSATITAYAVKSALQNQNSLDPEYYNANAYWRRLSVTLGVDFPHASSNSDSERGVIIGGKYLFYNDRDITTDREFSKRAEEMLSNVGRGIVDVASDPAVMGILSNARCTGDNGEFIDTTRISASNLAVIDATIESRATASLEYQREAAKFVKEINERPQVALQLLTNQRQGDATNEYQALLTADIGGKLDLGFSDSIALTANGGYTFLDASGATPDSQGGKVAAKLRIFRSAATLSDRVPWTIQISGDGTWKTHEGPQYRAQAGFSLALWDGVELPISVTWANQTELVKEQQVIGNIGFTVDTAKLLARFN